MGCLFSLSYVIDSVITERSRSWYSSETEALLMDWWNEIGATYPNQVQGNSDMCHQFKMWKKFKEKN